MTDSNLLSFYFRMLLLSSLLLWNLDSNAHELRPTIADITITNEFIDVSMRVNLEALMSEIGPDHSDSDDAPQKAIYDRLRQLAPERLAAQFDDYQPRFLNQVSLIADTEKPLPLTVDSLDIPPVNDIRLPRDSTLVLRATRADNIEAFSWYWARQYGAIILRVDLPDSSVLATDTTAIDSTVSLDGNTGVAEHSRQHAFTQYIQPGDTGNPIAISGDLSYSGKSSFVDYVIIGFEHIIPKGLDHILFVIGLFLLAPRLKPIVWQVSMFTLAHTITLALGITGLLVLPAQIVEPLIALSITIICIENLFGYRFRTSRLITVFVFGLLHGLGFAGVLSEIELPSGQFMTSLLAFNIGVELGQLAVVLMCFALVGLWFGGKPWYRAVITIPLSVAIGAIGLFWFLQRVTLI